MKVTFFHDHRFRIDEHKNYYSLGGLSNKTFDYYLEFFDSVNVVCREQKFKNSENKIEFTKISLRNINMECLEFNHELQLLGFKGAKKQIEEIVKNSECCIVRVPSFIGLIALEICLKNNIPVIVEVVANSWDSLWNYGNLFGKLLAPYIHFKSKRLISKSAYVIYVTEKYLQNKYPTKGQSIGCSDVILKNSNNSLNRYDKNLYKKKIILGTLAAIDVKFKGQSCVVRALGHLKVQGYTNFEYQLVGSGSSENLKKLAIRYDVLDQIVFIGALPHDSVFDWLGTIDIYIQPSKQEGLPRSVIEAMSTGAFCLGSDTGGIPELIERQYIFSNKRSNYKEIANLLISFDLEEAYVSGKINYEKSFSYKQEFLNSKRTEFFKKFISSLEIEREL